MLFLLWLTVRVLTCLLVLLDSDDRPRAWRSLSCGSSFGCCAARPAAQVHRSRPGLLAAASRVLSAAEEGAEGALSASEVPVQEDTPATEWPPPGGGDDIAFHEFC